MTLYNSLQSRELFHLEFLRWFGRKVKAEFYSLKGGANLRFFFNSIRYSEDMDLDLQKVEVHVLRDAVMKILQDRSFQDIFKPFGLERIVPPDITKAKQTETTQRFKIHLITFAGEDLYTKIEFSRRGLKGKVIVQSISPMVSRIYKIPPLLVPHYDVESSVMQKVKALADRAEIQARDIFDLYGLSSQCAPFTVNKDFLSADKLNKAKENLLQVSFNEFRDKVISYLSLDDQGVYNSTDRWDEIKLKALDFIEELT
jgi:predicted nucleotidyltransferase component of viral defense system